MRSVEKYRLCWKNQYLLCTIYIYIYIYNYYYYWPSDFFSHQRLLVVFPWLLSESKSSQVSRTFLSNLANLSNTADWMVSIRCLIFNSFGFLTRLLGTVPSELITIGITITLMFHSFLNSSSRSKYLSLFSFSLIFAVLYIQFIAQFPKDHLHHTVVCSLILSLWKITRFASYEINRLVFVTTKSPRSCPGLLVWDYASLSIEKSIKLFFPLILFLAFIVVLFVVFF